MPLVFEAGEFTQRLNEIMGAKKKWRRREGERDRYAEIILYFFIFCAGESVERQRRNSRGWRGVETLHARSPSFPPKRRNKKFSEKVPPKYSRCLTDFPGGVIHPSFSARPSSIRIMDSGIMIDGNVINGRWKPRTLFARASFHSSGDEEKQGDESSISRGRRPLKRIDPPSILMVICNSINSSSLGTRDKELSAASFHRWNWWTFLLYILFFHRRIKRGRAFVEIGRW